MTRHASHADRLYQPTDLTNRTSVAAHEGVGVLAASVEVSDFSQAAHWDTTHVRKLGSAICVARDACLEWPANREVCNWTERNHLKQVLNCLLEAARVVYNTGTPQARKMQGKPCMFCRASCRDSRWPKSSSATGAS